MTDNNKETALDKVSLAKPCSQNWDEMVGDERERFCNECCLNVYNLSSMTRGEAEEFLQVRNDKPASIDIYNILSLLFIFV